MSLQMGGIDHQLIGVAALGRQPREDTIKHADPASAHKAIVNRLVRPVLRRRIAPSQALLPDSEDNAPDNPPVIDPRHPVRQRKIGLDPAHLRL
jgi:hypothetical protein